MRPQGATRVRPTLLLENLMCGCPPTIQPVPRLCLWQPPILRVGLPNQMHRWAGATGKKWAGATGNVHREHKGAGSTDVSTVGKGAGATGPHRRERTFPHQILSGGTGKPSGEKARQDDKTGQTTIGRDRDAMWGRTTAVRETQGREHQREQARTSP